MSLQQALAPLLIWLMVLAPIPVQAGKHGPPPPPPTPYVPPKMLAKISNLNIPFTVSQSVALILAAPTGNLAIVAVSAGFFAIKVLQKSSYAIKGALAILKIRRRSMYGRQGEVLWAGFGRRDDLDEASPEVLKLLDTIYELSSTVITSQHNALPLIMLKARGETEAFLKALIEAVPDKTQRERILGQSLMGQLLQYQALIFQVFKVATSEDSQAINRLQSAVNDKQFYALLKQEAFRGKKNRETADEATVAAGN